MSETRNLRLDNDQERFVRQWFRDIAGDEDFEKNYADFMEAPATTDGPSVGANRRIIAAYLNTTDDNERRRAMYLLEIYHHKASGDRAASENWYARFAILSAQVGVAVILLIELLKKLQADTVDGLFWVITILFVGYVASVVLLFFWGSNIYEWLMSRKKLQGH